MFNVNFGLLKTIYVHLLVCYLNKLQNARCNDKEPANSQVESFQNTIVSIRHYRL